MNAILTLLVALTCANAQGPDDIRGERVPVELDVAPEILRTLTPEARAMVEATQRLTAEHLWRWEHLEADLPETVFADDAAIVTREDLFRTPEDDELATLMRTATGERRKFEPEHLDDLRDRALVIVPSKKYPGRNHVWRVRRFWLEGRENVRIRFEKARAEAYDQIVIQTAARWKSGEPVNVPDGARRFIRGWRELIAATVGAIELEPKYSDAQVTALLRKEALEELRSNGSELDLRLYDDELMKDVRDIAGEVLSNFERTWPITQEGLLDPKLAEFRARGLESEALAAAVREALIQERIVGFHRALEDSTALEKRSPGIAALLIARDRAVRLTAATVRASERAAAAESAQLVAKYEDDHRVLRWIPLRTRKVLAPEIAEIFARHRNQMLAELPREMRRQDLNEEAAILERNTAYFTGPGESRRARLAAETAPARRVTLERTIWDSKDWMPIRDDSGPTVKFRPQKTLPVTVTSSSWGWRAELFRQRTTWAFNEMNRYFIRDVFRNGRFGYRAVFGREPIVTEDVMNRDTGEVSPDPDPRYRMGTWRSVRRSIADQREAAKARFEALPDGDIFGKGSVRWFKYLTYSSTAALVREAWDSANTIGFLGYTLASGAVVATSPVLAPLYAVGAWLSDLVIADSTASHPGQALSPLLVNTAGRIGLGAGEVLLAMVSSAVVHPVKAAGIAGHGYADKLARSAWDKVWYEILRRLYLPIDDKGVASERISGPGLEQNFEFKISPKLSLVALRASLEREELENLDARLRAKALEPVRAATKQLVEPLAAMTVPPPSGTWFGAVARSSERVYREAVKSVNIRMAKLPRVGKQGVLVRLARADITATIEAAERLTRDFWSSREDRVDWNGRSLRQGDYRALAVHHLEDVFGPDFLQPVAPDDDTLVFVENTPDFGRAFDALLQDIDVDVRDVSTDVDRDLPRGFDPNVSPTPFFFDHRPTYLEGCETLLFR